jgi:hypothetical protein
VYIEDRSFSHRDSAGVITGIVAVRNRACGLPSDRLDNLPVSFWAVRVCSPIFEGAELAFWVLFNVVLSWACGCLKLVLADCACNLSQASGVDGALSLTVGMPFEQSVLKFLFEMSLN